MASAARLKANNEHVTKIDRASMSGLAGLAALGGTEIGMAQDLSAELHSLFDPVAEGALPIYFGPLLGRLYLESF